MPANAPNAGFVSLQQYLGANQGTLDAEAKRLAATGEQQAQQAQTEADQYAAAQRGPAPVVPGAQEVGAGSAQPAGTAPTYERALADQNKASQTLSSWNTYGGLYGALGNEYGKGGGYAPGLNQFDAVLLGSSPGAKQQFKDVQGRYGGLDTYLQTRDTTPAKPAPTAPPAAMPAPKPKNRRGEVDQRPSRAPFGVSSRTYDWRL